MDIIYLEGKSVLHVMDKDTQFSAAGFVSQGEATEDVWHIYMTHWVVPYVVYLGKVELLHMTGGRCIVRRRSEG